MMRLARRISQYGETEDTDAEAKSFFPLVCLTKVWPAFVLTQNSRYFGGIPDNGDSRWARYGLLSL